jgi:hypothetical protein
LPLSAASLPGSGGRGLGCHRGLLPGDYAPWAAQFACRGPSPATAARSASRAISDSYLTFLERDLRRCANSLVREAAFADVPRNAGSTLRSIRHPWRSAAIGRRSRNASSVYYIPNRAHWPYSDWLNPRTVAPSAVKNGVRQSSKVNTTDIRRPARSDL